MTTLTLSNQPFDLAPATRLAIAAAAGAIFAVSAYGFLRWSLGYAPPTPWVRGAALAVHLATVNPAIPLGAYVLLARKGGPLHKALGKIWLALMFTTAVATLFVRNVNDGAFSWIHLFTLMTFISVPIVIWTARNGRIEAHRRAVRNFFLGSLVIAGAFAFLPGRTMWQWAFGDPAVEQPSHG